MKLVKIINSSRPTPPLKVQYCSSFLSKFMGLMFANKLAPDSGIILVNSSESKIDSSIHMFFMKFDITTLWLDKNYVVVDKVLAKKWHPAYISRKPAQYVVETNATRYSDFSVGDSLLFSDENS